MNLVRRLLLRFGVASAVTGPLTTGSAVRANAMIADPIPDRPVSFGYKVLWFAVRTTDGRAVGQALGLDNVRLSNWAAGLDAAYARRGDAKTASTVFITPPIDGWILAVGMGLPYPVDYDPTGDQLKCGRRFRRLFLSLADRFEEVQFFGSYRVVDFYSWAKAVNGTSIRIFAWDGSAGEVRANEGPQTPEERLLHFIDLGPREPSAAREYLFMCAEEEESKDPLNLTRRESEERKHIIPDEDDVVLLAGAWSVNPAELDNRNMAPSLGLIGELS